MLDQELHFLTYTQGTWELEKVQAIVYWSPFKSFTLNIRSLVVSAVPTPPGWARVTVFDAGLQVFVSQASTRGPTQPVLLSTWMK